MKKLRRMLLVLVVIVLLALVGGYLYLDQITRSVIERGAAYATQTDASVRASSLAPWSGKLHVREATIDNPAPEQGPAFESPYFLSLGQGSLDLDWPSTLKKTVHLETVTLRDLTLHLERRDGQANYQIILRNLRRLTDPDQQPEDARKFVVDRLRLEDIRVSLRGFPGGERTLELPPIELTDVGAKRGGAVAAEITGLIIESLVKSMLSDVVQLPRALTGDLLKLVPDLGGLERLGRQIFDVDSLLNSESGQAGELPTQPSDEGEGGGLFDRLRDLAPGDEKQGEEK